MELTRINSWGLLCAILQILSSMMHCKVLTFQIGGDYLLRSSDNNSSILLSVLRLFVIASPANEVIYNPEWSKMSKIV